MPDLTSRPYKPDPAACCERCCFDTGEHADWCPKERAFQAACDAAADLIHAERASE